MLKGKAASYKYLRERVYKGNEASETSTPKKKFKCKTVLAEALPHEMPGKTFSDEANEKNKERTSGTEENQLLDNVSNQYLLSIVIATFYSYRVQGKQCTL